MKRYVIGGIGAVIVLSIALFLFFAARSGPEEAVFEAAQPWQVSLEREFHEGVHTISGTVATQDRCQSVGVQGSLASDGKIRIDISVSPDEGLCLELSGQEAFKVEIGAPEGAPVEAYVNGILSAGL